MSQNAKNDDPAVPPGDDPDRSLERELQAAEDAMHGDDCDCFECWPEESP